MLAAALKTRIELHQTTYTDAGSSTAFYAKAWAEVKVLDNGEFSLKLRDRADLRVDMLILYKEQTLKIKSLTRKYPSNIIEIIAVTAL